MITLIIILIIAGVVILFGLVINYILWEVRLEKAKEEIAIAVKDKLMREKTDEKKN